MEAPEIETRINALRWGLSKIHVYQKRDFDQVLRDFKEAREIVGDFNGILDPALDRLDQQLSGSPQPPRIVDQARLRLSKRRLFVEALARLRERRKK